MKVILKKEVEHLGYADDVVTVKNGHGRNFLIPQKLAVIANESNMKMLENKLKFKANILKVIKSHMYHIGIKPCVDWNEFEGNLISFKNLNDRFYFNWYCFAVKRHKTVAGASLAATSCT